MLWGHMHKNEGIFMSKKGQVQHEIRSRTSNTSHPSFIRCSLALASVYPTCARHGTFTKDDLGKIVCTLCRNGTIKGDSICFEYHCHIAATFSVEGQQYEATL